MINTALNRKSWKASGARRVSGALALGAALATGVAGGPARADQVIWQDEFPAGSIDTSKWEVGTNDNFVNGQRTRFGALPQVLAEDGTTFARVRMDSYNPNSSSNFLGSQLFSYAGWNVGPGLEWTARIRGTKLPRGIVSAFFPYRRRTNGDYARDRDQEEIDFEFLSNWNRSTDAYTKRAIWTNIWNENRDSGSQKVATGLDHAAWNTYTIRWLPNKVEWLVNGESVRVETTVVPDQEMSLCLNIWAPSAGGWDTAYDSSLQLTDQAHNTPTYFDVDYVRVTRLSAQTNQGSIGGGEGLTGVYYYSAGPSSNGVQFAGEKFSRIEHRLNSTAIDWGQGDSSFDARLPGNGWGALYRGELQAQYTEATTLSLSTQSSDGVRLWLGNQLLISKDPTSGTEAKVVSSGTANLQAGTRYPIRIEFWDGTGDASLKFTWSGPLLGTQIVNATQLYPLVLPTPQLSPAPAIYPGSVVVAATSVESGAGLHYTMDGSEPQYASPLVPANGVPINSSATLRVKAWKDGFWASEVAGGAYVIDTVPPSLALTTPRNGGSYVSLASVSGTASDNSTLSRIAVRLSRASDGKFWNASSNTWGPSVDNTATIAGASSGASWSLALPALADGGYTVTAQAFDAVGLASPVASSSFSVDNSAPMLAIDTPGENFSYPSLAVASGTAADSGPGVSEVRASLKRLGDGAFWNGQGWVADVADVPTDLSAAPAWKLSLPLLGEGAYSLTITAFDSARNAASLAHLFSIDATAPSISVGGPADNAVLKSAFVLNGSASDATSGIVTVGVHIQRAGDGAWWSGSEWSGSDVELEAKISASAGASGVDWTRPIPLFADGAYSARIVARDRAGNSAETSVHWRFDFSAPTVSVDDPAAGAVWSAWSAPRGGAADGASGSGVASVAVSLLNGGTFWDGAAWVSAPSSFPAALAGSSWSWPVSVALPPAVDGPYEVVATAVDGAGNSATARSGFSIAVPTPVPTATPVPTSTPVPEPTATAVSTATAEPTATTAPTAIPTIAPTATPVAKPVDRTPPRAGITSPLANSVVRVLPVLSGVASDNVGVANATVSLLRLEGRRYWNGSAWVAAAVALQPALSGGVTNKAWSFSRLPSGASLLPGLYLVTVRVVDTSGLVASAASQFRVDGRAPAIAFVAPSASPTLSTLSAPPSAIVLRASDDAAGTRSVEVLLRRGDGLYWNGRAWLASPSKLLLRAVNPTLGARPAAVLWQNGFAMPPASQWLPGSYLLMASASDWVGNVSSARLPFTLSPPSSVLLSVGRAEAASSTIVLVFSGPLDAAVAQSTPRFRAAVGGVARQVLAARYNVAARSVTLTVAGIMAPGARVQAWWSGLRDTSLRTLRDGTTTLAAR